MWERVFLNRLRKELPAWVERGWVAPAQQEAILAHVGAQAAGHVRMVPVALAVLGVLTFGTGVITFFAANWDGMAKLLKLAILFGGMWIAYGLGAYGLSVQTRGARVLGEALTLLGVLLFGANIMLIAQIYHIHSHFPNGVLLWALGALAMVYVAPLQTVAVVGLALATLWSGMEIVAFDQGFHWSFFLFWALFLPPILRHSWRVATAAAMLALFVGSGMSLFHWILPRPEQLMFLVQVYLLIALIFYIIGTAMESQPKLQPLSATVQRFALIAVLLCGHALVYEELHDLWRTWWQHATESELADGEHFQWLWVAGTSAVMVAALLLARWQLRRLGGGPLDRFGRLGLALLAVLAALMLANIFLPPRYDAVTALFIAVNLTTFSALTWLIVSGYRRGDRFQVNAAFLFFAFNMLALYFDYFWSLMGRSLFFMGGGALLFAGGYFLERQRRRLVREMARPEQGDRQ